MKAVLIRSFGNSNVLQYEDVEIPKINEDDQLLIKVHSAGVSPFDLHVRDGWYKDSYQFPIILGWELSGEVVAIGKNVTRFKIGDSVFGHPSVYRNGDCYAEHVLVKENEISHKPELMTDNEAAALSMNSLTAWQSLFDAANLKKGQKILIHAAAGGVGHIAIQLAKWKGAYVIGTASSKNKEFLLNLGADDVIDYSITDFAKELKNIDVVLDTIGGDTLIKSFSVTKKGGIVVSIVDFEKIKEAPHYGVQGKNVIVEPNSEQLSTISKLADEKILQVHIDRIYPLSEAATAQDLVNRGHVKGKVVLEIQ